MKYLVRVPIVGDLHLEIEADNEESARAQATNLAWAYRNNSPYDELDWHIQAQGWIRATEIKDPK